MDDQSTPKTAAPAAAVPEPGAALREFAAIVRRLRSPGGCPWDARQTPETLKTYVLEEAYELVEALDSGNPEKIREELGDLLLHLVFLSDLFAERGRFTLGEVIRGISAKMIHRHPHVFGEEKAETIDDLRRLWEEAKAREGKSPGGALGGVSTALPALRQAQRLGEAAARLGFDWPDVEGALDKVEEEMREFRRALAAGPGPAREEELGDLLFALVNVARFLNIDSEGALRRTVYKFIKRFHVVERTLAKQGKTPESASLEEMEAIWQAAKGAAYGVRGAP
ncbi:MAG: nucleoside triphosphate pyrophosphohydrolase [Deltaproteobacteria bacterium]|nr:nucleoside triphosphate pyrophosphohydrolase [Deltaproteobacteria bacterium]